MKSGHKMKKPFSLLLIIFGGYLMGSCNSAAQLPTLTQELTAQPHLETSQEEAPPTEVVENVPPVIAGLTDQSISDGERFEQIKLSDYVTDANYPVTRIRWEISGNEELRTRLLGSILMVTPPDADWTGSESLQIQACDPDGACDSVEIAFTIVAENDPPIIQVVDQVILPNEPFPEIKLSKAAIDEDHAVEEISWTIASEGQLTVEMAEDNVSISPPSSDWRGAEMVHFEACDPEVACDAKEVKFWVMDDTGIESSVTYVGNAGFLITAGEKKIIIDSLFHGFPPGYAPPEEVTNAIINGEPPFDGVDLILATHNHADHFSNGLVRQVLENHPEAIFISSFEATATIPQAEEYRDQIISININRGGRWAGIVNEIGVEAIHISHGGGILNLGFILTVGGHRYFHTGDISTNDVSIRYFQNYDLPEKNIDVAFVPHFSLIHETDHQLLAEGFHADTLIPMHYEYSTIQPNYDLMETNFPDAVVFREEMESWTLP